MASVNSHCKYKGINLKKCCLNLKLSWFLSDIWSSHRTVKGPHFHQHMTWFTSMFFCTIVCCVKYWFVSSRLYTKLLPCCMYSCTVQSIMNMDRRNYAIVIVVYANGLLVESTYSYNLYPTMKLSAKFPLFWILLYSDSLKWWFNIFICEIF